MGPVLAQFSSTRKDFSHQDLRRKDFRGQELIEANFDDTDLSEADFTGANCYGASFRSSRLYRTNFTRTNLSQARLDPVDMFGAVFSMECNTFQDTYLAPKYRAFCHYLMGMMAISPEEKAKVKVLVDEIGGEGSWDFFEKVRERYF